MSSIFDRQFQRLAVAAALMAALGLTGCGRKGALDAPPGASAAPQGAAQGAADQPVLGPDGRPVAAQPKREPFLLDWLVN